MRHSDRLLGGESLLKADLFCLSFGGEIFPEGLLVPGDFKLGFQRVELLRFLVMGILVLSQRRPKSFQLGAEFLRIIRRRLRWNERAGFEIRVFECPVEPDADLPDDLEHRKGGAMVPRERVVGGISRAADFAEQLVDLVWEDSVVPQATKEFELAVFRLVQNADVGSNKLGNDFRQLPELQETGIRIVCEVTFRKHPKTKELLIVRAQMGEVAAQGRPGLHRLGKG